MAPPHVKCAACIQLSVQLSAIICVTQEKPSTRPPTSVCTHHPRPWIRYPWIHEKPVWPEIANGELPASFDQSGILCPNRACIMGRALLEAQFPCLALHIIFGWLHGAADGNHIMWTPHPVPYRRFCPVPGSLLEHACTKTEGTRCRNQRAAPGLECF